MGEMDPAIPLHKEWEREPAIQLQRECSRIDEAEDDGDLLSPATCKEPLEHLRQRQRHFISTLMQMTAERHWCNLIVVSHSKFGGCLLGRREALKSNGKVSEALEPTLDYVDEALQDKLQN